MHSQLRDIASTVVPAHGLSGVTITAGGGQDDAWQNGPGIDTTALTNGKAHAAMLLVTGVSPITGGQNAAISGRVQHSDDNSVWSDLVPAELLATQTATGTAVGKLHVPMDKAKKWIRAGAKSNLSAGATDTTVLSGTFVLSGFDKGF
jgi:hypothetical protein